jgi:hypothetical protein
MDYLFRLGVDLVRINIGIAFKGGAPKHLLFGRFNNAG